MMRKYSTCLTHESQKRHSFDRSTYGPNKSTLHSAKYCVSAADKRSFESRHGMPPTWVFVMSTSRSDRTRTLLGDVGIESTSCEHKPQPNNETLCVQLKYMGCCTGCSVALSGTPGVFHGALHGKLHATGVRQSWAGCHHTSLNVSHVMWPFLMRRLQTQ